MNTTLQYLLGIVLAVFFLSTANALPSKQELKIDHLPGFSGNIPFNQYSGYIPVNEQHNRNLFFWFVESQNNPSSDPVVLWLNGGPGCSSLDGLLTEHGPFHIHGNNNTLYSNPYSWNRVANVIYLEAPAGVGFSYSGDPNDYYTDDNKTAADNLEFLKRFFKVFPEFSENDFWITGESWGGHYVPTLVLDVVKSNYPFNLKGFMVGNGATDSVIDANSTLTYIANHALTTEEDYLDAFAKCNGNFATNQDPDCVSAIKHIEDNLGDVNPYDIYEPCALSSTPGKSSVATNLKRTYSNRIHHPVLSAAQDNGEGIPCIDTTAAENYLNQHSVQKALHAKSTHWTVCTNKLHYKFDIDTLLPYYHILVPKLKALIYSGDADSVVNYLGTERWVRGLGLPVQSKWSPWKVDRQVAGYSIEYNNLVFATIKGAGHTVPAYKPKQAYEMFSRYLATGSVQS
eukprot:gb/GECH01011735.1/.p1 GENE.gb/GECH01011735.1/~~gb/GECH01011735.1/.p1  ORF type:complete len:457 (+),score=92.44 gb/GECH01011735.1/:1-1371(+)